MDMSKLLMIGGALVLAGGAYYVGSSQAGGSADGGEGGEKNIEYGGKLTNPVAVGSDPKYPEIEYPPIWDEEDRLVLPVNFRAEWVFLGAPLTPNALNNGQANFPEFHNVYTQPAAFRAYRETGKWPVGTMMVKELQSLDDEKGDFEDGSRIMPSGRGYFPGHANGIDAMVKDPERFPDSKNWGFFNFNHLPPPYKAAATEAPISECAGCHIANADEDMVYVNGYKPLLTPLPPGEGY